jgi:hypothetical protein
VHLWRGPAAHVAGVACVHRRPFAQPTHSSLPRLTRERVQSVEPHSLQGVREIRVAGSGAEVGSASAGSLDAAPSRGGRTRPSLNSSARVNALAATWILDRSKSVMVWWSPVGSVSTPARRLGQVAPWARPQRRNRGTCEAIARGLAL